MTVEGEGARELHGWWRMAVTDCLLVGRGGGGLYYDDSAATDEPAVLSAE